VRVIAKQFGVDPGTVQRISRPFPPQASSPHSRYQAMKCGRSDVRFRGKARPPFLYHIIATISSAQAQLYGSTTISL
jgi:hypothetical protein